MLYTPEEWAAVQARHMQERLAELRKRKDEAAAAKARKKAKPTLPTARVKRSDALPVRDMRRGLGSAIISCGPVRVFGGPRGYLPCAARRGGDGDVVIRS